MIIGYLYLLFFVGLTVVGFGFAWRDRKRAQRHRVGKLSENEQKAIRKFVIDRLTFIGKYPGMCYTTREAFCANVSLLLEIAGAHKEIAGVPAYKYVYVFAGARAGEPVDKKLLCEEVTDAWALEVVVWAKYLLES